MNVLNALNREARFLARDHALVAWMIVTLALSSIALWSGLTEIQEQNETIQRLVNADREDRQAELSQQSDWGSAAYYSFHLTYDTPSDFAFIALGQRDRTPWKHRIRMLALEGQIHEFDTGNPVFALIGRFDFAFFAAFVLPVILIVLLHDVRAGERAAGRHELLVATSGSSASLWGIRVSLRILAVFICAILPLFILGTFAGAAFGKLLAASLAIFVSLLFWAAVCLWVGTGRQSASLILTVLIGIWILLSTIVPAGGRMAVNKIVSIPSGAEILMTQREAVNDAWDLPKESTMQPFLARHPDWKNTPKIERPFEWKWYYAFQQVGDQRAEPLSLDYTKGRIERDRLAGLTALLSPPALLQRSLQQLANTDLNATIAYEDTVREFHAELRAFYYPGLFGDTPFSPAALEALPQFVDFEAR